VVVAVGVQAWILTGHVSTSASLILPSSDPSCHALAASRALDMNPACVKQLKPETLEQYQSATSCAVAEGWQSERRDVPSYGIFI